MLTYGAGLTPAKRAVRYGLVSHWRGEDLTDSYGTNTLTDHGTITYTAGKVGNAFTLASASSQYATVADTASIKTGNVDFWISLWAKFTTVGAFHDLFQKLNDAGTLGEYQLTVNSANKPVFSIWNNAGGSRGVITSTTVLTTATWYHLFAWHDATAGTVNVAVDGAAPQSAARSGAPVASTQALAIGASSDGLSLQNGQIDAIYWGKSPPLGMTALSAEMQAFFFKNGNGREYPSGWN